MMPRRKGREVAALAALCVLAIFFFPLMQGPYAVVHGPVTALQSARRGVRVQADIRRAALRAIRTRPVLVPFVPLRETVPPAAAPSAGLTEPGDTLRC
jgi:hypothetical protein